ncbi:MAG TPA: hypothetical protein VGV17_15880 [Bosea sp. (in: a-proteobacteria)]|jgi:hypothetical protein|uniref:hypothetical protein n=1 Tax=Bosea sp. (in: a-proteobacteria) TaxID=1871050 RepID=UPI002DDD0D37|nr:hypothetical protein [Bosea sp. (in: a-proteobacteria)]HEV2555234.1 hypothetical protein [Bosea sp. (in: a-proteobacteria)]
MSVVPLIPLRRADDLAERIEQLMSEAERRGYGTLAYLLDMALLEARIQMQQEADDRATKSADPRDLWEPKA